MPVGFRPNAGMRCVAASLVGWSAGGGETQHDSIDLNPTYERFHVQIG
jgi:hypothetical protein